MTGKKYFFFLPALNIVTAVLLILNSSNSFSQEYSPLDSINIGSKYKLLMFDESEIIGKVIGIDSLYIKIEKGKQVLSVRKDNIYDISKNLTPSKFRFMCSIGGGISFPAAEFVGSQNRNYKHSFSFQLNGAYLFKPDKALRFDLGYSRVKRKLRESWGDITVEGGTADMFSMKGDLLVGELRPKFNIYAYVFVGLGLHYINLDKATITEYMYYDSTYRTYSYEADREFNAVFCVGGGAGYRFIKSLGIYTEIQYTMASNRTSNIFGYDGGYVPVRFGLTYFIY